MAWDRYRFVYNNSHWVHFNKDNSSLPDNSVQCFEFDLLGNSWVGTANGMVKIENDNWEIFSYQDTDIGGWDIRDIAIDMENNVWTGFYWGQGISKYDGNVWQHYNTTFDSVANGISALSLSFDLEGNLWIGDTYYGLLQFNEIKIVSVANSKNVLEKHKIKLYAYPNPFNPSTTISYSLPSASNVKLIIYDIMGRMIKSFTANSQTSGTHQVVWDGRNSNGSRVSTGIYIYRFEVTSLETNEHFVKSDKLMLVK